MRMIAVVLTSCLAITATSGRCADPDPAMTADDLQQLCTGTDHVSRNACRIYILGVTQGIAVGLKMADGKSAGGQPCVPANISAETLEQTVKKRLDQDLSRSPEHKSHDAAAFVGQVLRSAYPCKAGN
jgi:Ssp1 endopeptidase immunity protein Rap1a